jgi:3-deoxy-manno-octulosonate cytidylyltransferase (CMP-KDO synthetase)
VARHSAISQVLVATDDPTIKKTVQDFQGEAILITEPCRTGTDRVAKIARTLDSPIILNLQSDEIFIHPDLLNDLIQPFTKSHAPIGTLKRRLSDPQDWDDPSVVKVVTTDSGQALYFSRSQIPFIRDSSSTTSHEFQYFMHLGIYIFRRETLLEFGELPSGKLEQSEQLEQLRALEAGIPIQVWETSHPSLRIDTPEDFARAEKIWPHYVSS